MFVVHTKVALQRLHRRFNGCSIPKHIPYEKCLFPSGDLIGVERSGKSLAKQRVVAEDPLTRVSIQIIHLQPGGTEVFDGAAGVFHCPGDAIDPIHEPFDVTATGKLEFLHLGRSEVALSLELAESARQAHLELVSSPDSRPELKRIPAVELRFVSHLQPLALLLNVKLLKIFLATCLNPFLPPFVVLRPGDRTYGDDGDDRPNEDPSELTVKWCHGEGSLNRG